MSSPVLLDFLDRNLDLIPQVFAVMGRIRATGRIPRNLDPLCSLVSGPKISPLPIPPKPLRPEDLSSYLSMRPELAKLFDENCAFLRRHPKLLEAMKNDLALAACVLRNIEPFRRLSQAPSCFDFVLNQPLLLGAIKRDPASFDSEEFCDERICLDEFKEQLESAKNWEQIRSVLTPAVPEYYGLRHSWSLSELLHTIFPPMRVILQRMLLSPLRILFYALLWLSRLMILGKHLRSLHKLAVLGASTQGSRVYRFVLRQRPCVLVCMPFDVHAANLAYRTLIKPMIERRLGGKCVRVSHPVKGDWRAHLRLHMLYSHLTLIDVSLGNQNVADEWDYFRILSHNLDEKKGKVLVSFDDDLHDDLDLEASEKVFRYSHLFLPLDVDRLQSHIEVILQDLGFKRGFLDPWVLYPTPNPQFPNLKKVLAFERSWIRTELPPKPIR